MARTFRQALIATLEARNLSLREVAEGAGVSLEQLKKLRQRPMASTNVDDAKKVANWLGFSLDEFLGDEEVEARSEAIALWQQLSPRERQILKAAASALPAPDRADD